MMPERFAEYKHLEQPIISMGDFLQQMEKLVREHMTDENGRIAIEDDQRYMDLLCKVMGHRIVPCECNKREHDHCSGCMRVVSDLDARFNL